MDGEDLGKAIKADPQLGETLLIMMTSMGKRGDAKRLHALGFSAYLTKPVKQSQLFDCLSTVLGMSHEPAAAQVLPLITRHTLNEAQRRQIRILLVEDNLTNQQVALRILEKLGFRANAVGNGREAVEALEQVPYDLVFMDVQMLVMDGFTATQTIRGGRTNVLNPEIPIIAMTAHAMKGDRERCIGAGMNDYISKPISPKDLAEVLDKWLNHIHKSQPAVPEPFPQKEEWLDGPLVFDRETLTDRLMGDEELVREICAGFLEDMTIQIRELRQSIERNDEDVARRMSHTIKGAAANVGAMALNAVALNMEKTAKAGQLEELVPVMSEMERQFDLLKIRMEETLI